MKISEVIKGLRQMRIEHGDLEVFTEGCDCNGDVGQVVLVEGLNSKKWAILARTDGDYASGRQW